MVRGKRHPCSPAGVDLLVPECYAEFYPAQLAFESRLLWNSQRGSTTDSVSDLLTTLAFFELYIHLIYIPLHFLCCLAAKPVWG